MPIREFSCRACKRTFETLILGSRDRQTLRCPKCGGRRLQQLFSVFGVAGAEKKVKTASRSCSSCTSRSCSTCG